MFGRTHLTIAAFSLTMTALTAHNLPSAAAQSTPLVLRGGHWCGTPQVMPTTYQAPPAPSPFLAAQRVIWLNRAGGTYSGGPNTNSATNTVSSGIFGSGTFTVAPMSNRFDWPTLVACVKEHYKPYNVRFVETKPTSGKYVQAVVGGTGDEVRVGGGGLLGIAAADNFCGVTEAGIAFSFSEAHVGISRQTEELCATVAHEIGHVLSLEHEILGKDTMSYVPISSSVTKSFVNAESQCGTEPGRTNACSCPITSGSNNTNSGKRLLEALGARPTDNVAPTITIDSPKANATLGPSFPVTATATDNMGVESVVLLINGQERGSDEMADTGNKYIVNAINLPEGEHEIIMQATDNAGNITKTAPIKITVAKQVTGGDCLSNSDCKGNLCADDGTQKFCTESCSLDNDTCPSGFDCAAVGATAVCAFSADDETGGCCDAGNSSSSAAMFGAFMVGLVLLRKRRTA